MGYTYDATGVEPSSGGQGKLIPEGKYLFQIKKTEEGKSQKGNYMVKVKCAPLNNPDVEGKELNHTVTFLAPDAKGAGMAIHFLKTIGEPWEGPIEIAPENWEGKQFVGTVKHEPYESKRDGKTYTSAKLNVIEPVQGEIPF